MRMLVMKMNSMLSIPKRNDCTGSTSPSVDIFVEVV